MKNSSITYRIILSGGGTGGHIFPALAVAQELRTILDNVEILFVGAEGKMEMKKVPEAGFKIVGLKVSGIQRRITLKNLTVPFKLILSIKNAWSIVKKFNPDVVIGFGGYASGPTLLVSNWMGKPTLIQEQNSYAGITNKWLGRSARKICVAYHGMEAFFPKDKIMLTGNPIRKQLLLSQPDKKMACQFFGLDTNKRTILVIGGSLGARTINESLIEGYSRLISNNIQVVWQCGSIYYQEIKSRISEHEGLILRDFIKEMEMAYASADLVISRAGALSLSEITVLGKASILIPSPNVAEDHQAKNAYALVSNDAAVMVKDSVAKSKLIDTILEIAQDENRLNTLAFNSSKMALRESERKITEEILRIVA